MGLLLAYLFLALFVSFLCSIMESVLLSASPSFLFVKKEEGHAWADKFLELKTDVDRPLSAILSLNTVAHTIGAAGVGAQAVAVFGQEMFGIISAVLTILILVITEIIPKTVGAQYWRRLAKISTFVMTGMIFITYPLVVLSAQITRIFAGAQKENTVDRDEIAALASIGADEGVFTDREYRIIQNILKLKNVKVSEIMTPRVVVAAANEDTTLEDFLRNKSYLNFSRIPVYSGHEENITGYVFRQEVFENIAEKNGSKLLREIKREIIIVPDTVSLFSLWERLLEFKEHIAVIVDEYGGLEGIVTMEDVIETLLGLEIMDEKDTVKDMQKYARERWQRKQAKRDLIKKLKDN